MKGDKSMKNKVSNYLKTRAIGFYLSLVCILLLLIQLISYLGVPKDVYNVDCIISLSIGLVLAIISLVGSFFLSVKFNYKGILVPMITMMFSFLSLLYISRAEGAIDYFTTQFFGGVNLQAILNMPFPLLLTILSLLLGFILSSVTIYLPQEKQTCKKGE